MSEPLEINLPVREPVCLTKEIRATDGPVNIPIPASARSYLALLARYSVDDASANVKAGDPAPFLFSINGEADSRAQVGLTLLTENVMGLILSTPYDTHPVELTILAG